MVLFSHPDAVREVFGLDPGIAPAGRSWEFLRPFAGPNSILLLDGEQHLRERRMLQRPFHGERMRAFAPVVAELARRELSSWEGRVLAAGWSPYRYAPADPALVALRDGAIWSHVNNVEVPSPYPPVAQMGGLLGAALTPHSVPWRLFSAEACANHSGIEVIDFGRTCALDSQPELVPG